MSFYIENESGTEPFPDYENVLGQVMEQALLYEHCPYQAEVSLFITDNGEIQNLNRETRNMDKPTDVLSFPMNEFESPGDFSALENSIDAFNPETGELVLGDIVISYEKAIEQAGLYGHSIKREMSFLTAHSMLHLMGYDHMNEGDREEMEKRQEEILEILGITR